MSKPLTMDNKVLMSRIDLLGLGVADTAKYIQDDDIMWSMNQATIALQDAYRRLERKEEESNG